MEAIILAGGLGTRLRSVISDVPKVLAPINKKPFIEYILDNLRNYGIDRVILAVGYKKECIQEYFGETYKNIEILYSAEDTPLGTGGAIRKAMELCKEEDVIILNGDVYSEINYKELLLQHKKTNANISLVVKKMDNFERYGSVKIVDSRITEFYEKKFISEGYMSVGCYVFKKNLLNSFAIDVKFSIENDFFVKNVKNLFFTPFIYEGIFIDIGIPEDYELAQKVIGDE